jgi:hypothetical protein
VLESARGVDELRSINNFMDLAAAGAPGAEAVTKEFAS